MLGLDFGNNSESHGEGVLLTCSMVSTDVWAAGLALTGFRITASTAAWAAALAAAAAVAWFMTAGCAAEVTGCPAAPAGSKAT